MTHFLFNKWAHEISCEPIYVCMYVCRVNQEPLIASGDQSMQSQQTTVESKWCRVTAYSRRWVKI